MTAATALVSHLLHPDFGLPCLFPPPAAAHEACFPFLSMLWVDDFLPELRLLLKVLGNPSNISLQRSVPQRSCLGKELKDRRSQSFYWRLSSKNKQTNTFSGYQIFHWEKSIKILWETFLILCLKAKPRQ